MRRHPTRHYVYDPKGLWSVFYKDYDPDAWADNLEWPDVRGSMHYEFGPCSPIAWEMNWAAYPVGLPPFDEDYGKHIGHENQQFAWGAFLKTGARTYIDPTNEAFSLPHRHYFVEEWEQQQSHRDANYDFHQGLYGNVESLTFGEHQG